MRFTSSSNGLAVVAILSSTATAIHPKHHAFLKRQGCNNIDSQCSSVGSTDSDCINYICSDCTSVDPAVPQCCELSSNIDIANCIQENLDTSSSTSDFASGTYTYSGAPTVTTPALLTSNPDCSSVLSSLDVCASATPGFDSADFLEQASCLCYSGSNYAASAFDDPYSTCLDVLSSSDFQAYMLLTIDSADAASTPCAFLSDVQGTSGAGAASSDGAFTAVGGAGGGAVNTNSPATRTPSPGSKPTANGGGGPRPTRATSSSTTSASPAPNGGAGNNNAGNNVAGNGVDALGAQIVFIGIASFVAVLYLL
ncbi:MAG: hypothetical protein Q9225_006924 [Loekoesia sp. 1 TL-2023]